jgi:maltooligosyltrehalose trehalohydrolase
MTRFRVWAPRPSMVELDLGDRRLPMIEAGSGWWSLAVPDAGPGSDYAFVLDDGPPLPDPRSPWQPDGVDGRSRVVDHARYRWTDRGWQAPPLAAAIVYELHVGTFSPAGSFAGVMERLGYLRDLGVTHVELMPVAQFSGHRGWGYDGVGLWAPHHAYGAPDDLKRLVDACHAEGLAVILDVVYNHLGPAGNHLARFGPYFTDRYRTPWGEAINLDGPDSDEVRRFICDNALMWLRDYHMDGLRLDAVHAIVDTSARHLLEQLSEEVDVLEAQLGRHLVLIAESDLNDPRVIRPPEVGGHGIDAQWADDLHHALHAMLTGELDGYYADFGGLAPVAKALEDAFVYDGRYSTFRRRVHGRPAAGSAGHRFVTCLQNHDQVGNRAQGERIGHLADIPRLRIGAALSLTAASVPMVFQGEEWAASTPFQYFTDHRDRELARAVSEGRREEFAAFGWDPEDVPDPQAPETFERSRLDWTELEREPHAGLLAWYRALIRARRQIPALRDGLLDRVRVLFDEAERWIIVDRGAAVLACNLGDRPLRLPAPRGDARIVLASPADVRLDGEGLHLPAQAVCLSVVGPGDAGVAREPRAGSRRETGALP